MSLRATSRVLLLMMLVVTGRAFATDLSKYPCTVFNADVCFRLPTGTKLDYSIPVDFHLYTVLKGSSPVATIYVGSAPQQPEVGVPIIERKTSQGVLRVVRTQNGGDEGIEIYITPLSDSQSTIHISANTGSDTIYQLRELLSSLRPCRAIKSGGQRCPKSGVWSKEIVDLLNRTPKGS